MDNLAKRTVAGHGDEGIVADGRPVEAELGARWAESLAPMSMSAYVYHWTMLAGELFGRWAEGGRWGRWALQRAPGELIPAWLRRRRPASVAPRVASILADVAYSLAASRSSPADQRLPGPSYPISHAATASIAELSLVRPSTSAPVTIGIAAIQHGLEALVLKGTRATRLQHFLSNSAYSAGQLLVAHELKRGFQALAGSEVAMAQRASAHATEEAEARGKAEAARLAYLWLHGTLLTSLNDLRLRCEQLNAPSKEAVCDALTTAEASIRDYVYRLLLSEETVSVATLVSRLFDLRRRRDLPTAWSGPPLLEGLAVNPIDAMRVDRMMSAVGVLPELIEVTCLYPHSSKLALAIFGSLPSEVPAPFQIDEAEGGRRRAYAEFSRQHS